LLPPAERCFRTADFQHEIIFVSGAHLARRERSLRAVIESHQHGCQVIDPNVDGFQITCGRCGLKRVARKTRSLPSWDDCRDVPEHMSDPQAGYMLREIAPMRTDVSQGR